MYSKGKFHSKGKDYDALVNYTKSGTEVLLISKGTIVSAYKTDKTGNYSFASMAAQDLFKVVSKGLGYCNSKNGTPMPFVGLGAVNRHEFSKMKLHYDITEINHELVECDISNNETDDNGSSKMTLSLSHIDKAIIPNNIAYVKLTEVKDVKTVENAEEDLDNIVTRSIEEIALTKEDGGAWLKNKKYYIVNDDATAEQIFEYLDNYDGAIAYDTETTGLKINCFGKVGSHYEKELAEYNASHPDEKIREDRLVGIIFCVEPNVSYYFPVFNRKFKNLYQDLNSLIRKKTVEIIKARYTTGEFKDRDSDMANYIRNTPENEWRLDVILMERVRDILSKKHIVTHGGIFEWRVGWTYEIDTNICDDTMIIHQLIYKFRSTTSNAGEPSNLKYLAKHDLGVDQWELKDFFPNFKADDTGLVKERKDGKGPKKGSRIDFSYMDYAGTQIYAPADGDMTLELYLKYKKDMLEHFKDFEYIYNIEIIVTCAMGYVEFYGHRINESKINGARLQTAAEIVDVEEQIRQAINYASQDEINVHNQLKTVMAEAEKGDVNDPAISGKLDGLAKKLRETIDANTDHALNINSPAQVAALFFDVLGYPDPDGKRSVSKKVYKGLAKEVGDDGKLKYPIAGLYQKYKAKVTLQTKFFDQLQYFQYPEGLIFSDFGQISTATGRMSCKHPNCQQYPKVITKIVEPRPGYIMLDADYSQIEYRVLTALAHNSGLRELFSSPDSDYHTLMASLMYDVPYASVTPQMRSSAKSFNFGIPYGMGFKSLAILLHGNASPESVDDAKVKYEMYFKNQPNTRKFFDNVKEQAQVYGYTKTAFNRRRYYNFTSKDGTVNNAKKAAALRQAGNAVIQGSAADIFKISLARNFTFIRNHNLYGKLLIINLIHDEQLMEVDVQHLNAQRILAEVGRNMQFSLPEFPPLYIGAGIGKAWGTAKGKMAEIHPLLLEQYTKEAINISIERTETTWNDPSKVIEYFDKRNLDFRRKKVADYITDPSHWNQPLHPAIGGLINLQFNYGRGGDAKAYVDENGNHVTDAEFLEMNLADFIKENGLNVDPHTFFEDKDQVQVETQDEEEDKEYDDDDDENPDDIATSISDDPDKVFSVVDESDKTFGSSLQDIISVFGCCLLENQRVCGIDLRGMSNKGRNSMIDALCEYVCEPTDSKGLQLVFLKDGNILDKTGVYVSGINGSKAEAEYKKFKALH